MASKRVLDQIAKRVKAAHPDVPVFVSDAKTSSKRRKKLPKWVKPENVKNFTITMPDGHAVSFRGFVQELPAPKRKQPKWLRDLSVRVVGPSAG